ncbi:MAG TPA: DUF4190 domain-containing protein [Acidimicrobiales bacterium]|nr:DUF4190 domain-containing protein [Acidimicrobiales bacterium]
MTNKEQRGQFRWERGMPAPTPARATQPRNGMGIAALVLGILSLVGIVTIAVGAIFGILALVFGVVGWSRARRGQATNGGLALAGAITGGVGLKVSVALVVSLSFFVATRARFRTYSQCLGHATTQGARQVCARQFHHRVAP